MLGGKKGAINIPGRVCTVLINILPQHFLKKYCDITTYLLLE